MPINEFRMQFIKLVKEGIDSVQNPLNTPLILNFTTHYHSFQNGAPTRNRTSIYGLGNHCSIR